jgi:hypothetical protein
MKNIKIKNNQLFGKGCKGFQQMPGDIIDFLISMKNKGACFNKKLKKGNL